MMLFYILWQPDEDASYVSALRHIPPLRFVEVSFLGTAVSFATSIALTALFTRPVLRQLGYQQALSQNRPGAAKRLINLALMMALFIAMEWLAQIFFTLPALILVVFFWVVMPIAVIEDVPPIAAFRRSAALVKGHFWAGLALLGGYGAAYWLCSKAIEDLYTLGILGRTALIASFWVLATGYFLAGSVLDNVAYYLLRREKDGVTAGDIGDVFD